MTRILDRLVARSFLKVFLSFILAAPILFVLGDVTENLDSYLNQGLTWGGVVKAYAFKLPQFVQWSFPIAALVAAVFSIQTMTQHREIVAAKAGGVSFHRLIVPIIVLGFLLTGAALGMEEVVPRTERIAAEILNQEDSRREFRSNFVFQGDHGRNFAIRSLNVTTGTMQGVVMETLEPGVDRPSEHLVAARARYTPEEGWTFEDGRYRIFPTADSEKVFAFESFQIRGFLEKPEDLLETPRKPEEMTYAEMGRLANIMLRSGGDPLEAPRGPPEEAGDPGGNPRHHPLWRPSRHEHEAGWHGLRDRNRPDLHDSVSPPLPDYGGHRRWWCPVAIRSGVAPESLLPRYRDDLPRPGPDLTRASRRSSARTPSATA